MCDLRQNPALRPGSSIRHRELVDPTDPLGQRPPSVAAQRRRGSLQRRGSTLSTPIVKLAVKSSRCSSHPNGLDLPNTPIPAEKIQEA
jgi:hypothetical protein